MSTEKETIEEGNKVIAIFMGWSKSTYWNTPNKLYKQESDKNLGIHISQLEYHSSWDWLMPVLRRIDEMFFEGFPIMVSLSPAGGCVIRVNETNAAGQTYTGKREIANTLNDNYFNDYPGAEKVEPTASAFNAAVTFIQWFNKQNQQTK